MNDERLRPVLLLGVTGTCNADSNYSHVILISKPASGTRELYILALNRIKEEEKRAENLTC